MKAGVGGIILRIDDEYEENFSLMNNLCLLKEQILNIIARASSQ